MIATGAVYASALGDMGPARFIVFGGGNTAGYIHVDGRPLVR